MTGFIDQVNHMEQQLHSVVDTGDDQALFIASYLHGHFDVVVSQIEKTPDPSIAALDKAMAQSLDSAFANAELESSDQYQVTALWQTLVASVNS
ncbi:YfcL family protein [Alteromonas sp. ASW11-36]|uniref:YfcL family protein n=1 Tax=Alteromonas arenosi TaxID=3055817 RepID=A0ABT7SVV3_9ALTE|nr:YfcL family protein [Alteromonas sp. ASW11-36]MDM7860318.1 YfcL family protein [Alteromonas sp. ASW11-36]